MLAKVTGACSAANLAKVLLLRINGPKATFNGVDFRASYRFEDVFGGDLIIGGVGNRTVNYSFAPFTVAGLPVAGFEAVGMLNAGTLAHTLPEWKWQGYVNYARGPVNLRWSVRYTSHYIDQRQTMTAVGRTIDASMLHDVAAVVELPRNVTFSLAVTNVFDEEPPLARLAEGYDAMTSDPRGRTIRTGLRMAF